MTCNCANRIMGAIGPECFCGNCADAGTVTPGTTNIYNDFSILNNNYPIYQSPIDGSISQPVVDGTIPGSAFPGSQPLPEGNTTVTDQGTTATIPTSGGITDATANKPFPWWLLLVLGYAGYQVVKEKKPQQKRK